MLTEILVHMDRGPGCTARLMAAINLAQRHNALLRGLYVIAHPHYGSVSDYAADYGQVRDFFINAASKSGVQAAWQLVDWKVVGTPTQTVVSRFARYCDLTLVGQPTGNNVEYHEQILLTSGRPIIIFPKSGESVHPGKRIVIAWKGGRESTRVVIDAFPLLKKAEQVTLLSVAANSKEQETEQQGMEQMREHLARHQLTVSCCSVPLSRSLSATILQQAAAEQADLLVVGPCAYSSNRVPLLSPLSRTLLTSSPLPLFMSH